jgi:hypothetical protein
MGTASFRAATDPIAIEVTTAEPLGNTSGTSSLEIYLDEQRLRNTRPQLPNRLTAFVADRGRLRPGIRVTVEWLGSEGTRSRTPIFITNEHLAALR